MKLLRSLTKFRSFCTIKPTQSSKNQVTSLTRYQHFTQVEAKELAARPNELRQIMLQMIQKFGQLKIQKYWRQALTDPQFGYYSQRNVFSKEGDFTTSPEISPLFGEMIGVWIVYFLSKVGIFNQTTCTVNKKFRLVQLGGGRGLLMKDIVRSLHDLKITNNFDITFIEVSEYNRKAQQDSLNQQFKQKNHFFKFQHTLSTQKFQYFTSQNPDKNIAMSWIQTIEDFYHMDSQKKKKNQQVPFTIFVMNQFFDALPITVFGYTSQSGWKQKVLKKSLNNSQYFDLGYSSHEIPQKLRPVVQNPQSGQQIELSPTSFFTMDLMARTIEQTGGAILNIDYGDQGVFSDSIRAIKDHKYIPSPHFWQIPGMCDLSAYVNFQALAQYAQKINGIVAYQAIPQGYFLEAMGIVPRVDLLKKNATQQNKKRIQSQYQRLVLPSQMGQIYKIQIITKKQYGQIYPYVTENQHSF